MNWRAIRAIMRKDLRVALKSRAVVLPMIIVPLILIGLLPAAVTLIPQILQNAEIQLPTNDFDDLLAVLGQMPTALQAELADYTPEQAVVVLALTYLFAPLYLILPLMVSSVLAADSFAGEKERKTLEALLYSPTTERELLLGKVLASWLAGVGIAFGGFIFYAVIVNATAWPIVGRLFFPNAMWLLLVFWVAPAVAGLSLGATVLVSARVNTFQEAYQLGGLVVLPVIALMIGQISGLFYFHVGFVALLGLVLWLVNGLLFLLSSRTFRRSQLLAKL
jgi:ABC-2 type transport system permease protein